MAIGMSYEQFWCGDVYAVKFFKQAHEYKIELRNQELWLQGLYDYKAFKAVIDDFAFNMNGRKGVIPDGYIKSPLAVTEREKAAEKQRNIERTLAWVAEGQKSE